MDRTVIINTIGIEYHTPNVEKGEYSYVQAAGSRKKLKELLDRDFKHVNLDIRFQCNDVVVLVETKTAFVKEDENQLLEYYEEEIATNKSRNVICILANTNDDNIKVWKGRVNDENILPNETIIQEMSHYIKIFDISKQNNREKVLKNTYDLNELLHKKDIDEAKRSQFVGTCLLYIKDLVKRFNPKNIDDVLIKTMIDHWSKMTTESIIGDIKATLEKLLDGSAEKELKIKLLKSSVLEDQKVRTLILEDWQDILSDILANIYRYINTDSSEGQDILNLFFIAFNKYTGKADKNQAYTPDHITDFMAKLTQVDRSTIVLDPTCGSGSFLVQSIGKAIADCYHGTTDDEAKTLISIVKEKHIYGIECEEKAYGLSTTNMLIHGDGNSNIIYKSCFDDDSKIFIQDAAPDVILMNPPYNAKPKNIPKKYKKEWAKDKKEDPTKGLVFIHYLSDVIKEMNKKRERNKESKKYPKLAVLLPVSAAIGSKDVIEKEKKAMLMDNTLEAVFTLPDEIFYPGASVCACCMLFTMGKPHPKDQKTFFGFYKDDGFKKKKNLGRVEQFDESNNSKWKTIEEKWLSAFKNKTIEDGFSAMVHVGEKDEWLCEAYMKTDFSTLCQQDFQTILNNYISFLVKEGKVYEK